MLRGDSGKDFEVRKRRTFWGALCSENHDVPGSSSSFTSEALSESSISVDGALGVVLVVVVDDGLCGCDCERCASVRA